MSGLSPADSPVYFRKRDGQALPYARQTETTPAGRAVFGVDQKAIVRNMKKVSKSEDQDTFFIYFYSFVRLQSLIVSRFRCYK